MTHLICWMASDMQDQIFICEIIRTGVSFCILKNYCYIYLVRALSSCICKAEVLHAHSTRCGNLKTSNKCCLHNNSYEMV